MARITAKNPIDIRTLIDLSKKATGQDIMNRKDLIEVLQKKLDARAQEIVDSVRNQTLEATDEGTRSIAIVYLPDNNVQEFISQAHKDYPNILVYMREFIFVEKMVIESCEAMGFTTSITEDNRGRAIFVHW